MSATDATIWCLRLHARLPKQHDLADFPENILVSRLSLPSYVGRSPNRQAAAKAIRRLCASADERNLNGRKDSNMAAVTIQHRPNAGRFALALASLCGALAATQAEELIYKEDFNTEGEGTRYTVEGRGFVPKNGQVTPVPAETSY